MPKFLSVTNKLLSLRGAIGLNGTTPSIWYCHCRAPWASQMEAPARSDLPTVPVDPLSP